ncbi:MAG: SDR family NAD(P)-dependent oxidoreductase [Endozoicomonadaceae bacterium]|nr:SDR family NAD(P)-dependent oxidoreductase [Endozoicomonadaceae bacterium]
MSIKPKNIVIFGAGGAIGSAFIRHLSETHSDASIHAFSRQTPTNILSGVSYHAIDYTDETSIEKAAREAAGNGPPDLVIVAIGILHDDKVKPEKSLKQLSAEKFQYLFAINTVTPALIAKYFLPIMNRQQPYVFAALSARVGSISDNQLGGWYAYRASKAALNMIIRNAAIEIGRCNKQAIIVALHPGTVDSNLSGPFQHGVPDDQLFTPDYATGKLLAVLDNLTPQQSGKFFAWDGEEISP